MYRRIRPSDSSHEIHDGVLMENSDPWAVFEEDFDIPDGHKPVLGLKLIGSGGIRYSYINNTYKGSAEDKRNYCVYIPLRLWNDLGLEDPESDVVYLEPIRSLPVAHKITVKVSGGDEELMGMLRDSLEEALMYAVLIEKWMMPLESMGIDAVVERVEDLFGNDVAVSISGREIELVIEGLDEKRPDTPIPEQLDSPIKAADGYVFGIPELSGVREEPQRFVGSGRAETTEAPALTKEQVRAQRLARLG